MKTMITNTLIDLSDYIFDRAIDPENKLHVVMFAFQKLLYRMAEKLNPQLFNEWIQKYG